MGSKSLCISYFLWLIGGWLGLHHFYLKRYKQSFIWFCLPGGFFGLGWIRDLWRIPTYVREANQSPDHTYETKKPPIRIGRIIGQMIVGNAFGVLIHLAIPEEGEIGIDLSPLRHVLTPIFVAFGIWMVGNIGKEKGSIFPTLIACYIVVFFIPIFVMTLIGVIIFQIFSRNWRLPEEESKSRVKSTVVLIILGLIYLGLIFSFLYFNFTVMTAAGDEIKFRHAIKNFLKSPAVQEFSKNLRKLFQHMLEFGFFSTAQQLMDSLDPLGEKNSLKVLDLPLNATQSEIKSKYKALSRIWHPDKFINTKEKDTAHSKFIAIQEAYEKLSSIKKQRSIKIKNSRHLDDEL
uniref:DnaJ homolog subfamily C member 22 n=2 Tax=Lepeophtheirus salmonis TaxID=72036 RepID=A0A0K2V1Q9_LEPSM